MYVEFLSQYAIIIYSLRIEKQRRNGMTNNNKILDKMWDNAPIDITQGAKFILKSCILQNLFIFVFFVIFSSVYLWRNEKA